MRLICMSQESLHHGTKYLHRISPHHHHNSSVLEIILNLRHHLGASLIGHVCRALSIHCVLLLHVPPSLVGFGLSIFARGWLVAASIKRRRFFAWRTSVPCSVASQAHRSRISCRLFFSAQCKLRLPTECSSLNGPEVKKTLRFLPAVKV